MTIHLYLLTKKTGGLNDYQLWKVLDEGSSYQVFVGSWLVHTIRYKPEDNLVEVELEKRGNAR